MEFRVPTLREAVRDPTRITFLPFFLERHHFLERVLEFSQGFVAYS